jgi:hypothetical protein
MTSAVARSLSVEPANPAHAAPTIACGRCRHAYSPAAWDALPRLETLTADYVVRHVAHWRRDRAIEVRSCFGCGRPMARIVDATQGRR